MNVEDDNSNNDNNVDITDDLNQFEDLFYERTKEEIVEEPVEEEQESDNLGEDDNPPAPEDEEDEAPEEEEVEEEDEPEVEDEPKGKKNRKSFQERINELTAERREAEREAETLRRELEAFRKAAVKEEKVETPLRDKLPDDAPNPDATDEDGEPLYELGEFDPAYIRDLTKYTIAQETAKAKEEAAREAQEAVIKAELEEVKEHWIAKLDAYEEEVPEIRENIAELTDTFQNIEPSYGEYLATTIMASEFGPQIMNYLSQNIGEAQKIVASGPAAATLALGRLEARFITSTTKEEPKRNTRKVSEAPEPPQNRSRGSNGKFAVAPDTDDLSAFEREFYKGS